MRVRTLLLTVTVAVLLGFAPAPYPKAIGRNDLEKIQGKWIVIYDEDGGTVKTPNKRAMLELAGNRMIVRVDGKVENQFIIRLHPGRKVRSLDLIPTRKWRSSKGDLLLGIYCFDDDRLTICASKKARPNNFNLGLKGGAILILKRRHPERSPKP